MSKQGILQSSLAKKYVMALTGLFLCLFLVGHLLGNLQLFQAGEEGKHAFNAYARFMTTFPLVKLLSYLTYLGILFHVVDGIVLTLANRKARPVSYAMERGDRNAGWSSRNMGILGTVILAFIVVHMQNFWFQMHFGDVPYVLLPDGTSVKDLHTVVMRFFDPAYNSLALGAVALYVLAQVAIGFHLWHGFESAFQSLGVRHPRYSPMIQALGRTFSVLVPLLFAVIPVYLYLQTLSN
jgi:succinate dehydrogenase / fumarate reductase cytochrome b subunit